jgi:rSAM/selenodomain-associated transferase 1
MNDRRLLGIFAKQPILGQAKTRLAQATSAAFAQQVAEAFLEDSLDRFSGVAASRAIMFTPASAADYFTGLAARRYDCVPQGDGDLGQRLQTFFVDARLRGFGRIIAMGSDSPTLPVEYVEQAFVLLATHDVVIGPAFDGGYYLIGCGTTAYPIFDGIPWSTPRVLEATMERLRGTAARVALLPPWYDVDTADDWAMLRGHLQAMRRAGIDPGAPRTERLVTS